MSAFKAINTDNEVTRGRGLDHLFDPMCKCRHPRSRHHRQQPLSGDFTFCCDIDCDCNRFEYSLNANYQRRWKDLLK